LFRLFECCALSFFERFVLSFSLKIERFVSDSAEIWICGLYCFKLPKATDEEKAARSAAIQEATRHAALIPMEVARKALEVMPVIADIARLGNRNAITDACVAMMAARSAVLGALLNVRINLGVLKDKEFVLGLQAEADRMEQTACRKEKELLDAVNQDLRV